MYQYKITFLSKKEIILFANDLAEVLKILHKRYPRAIHTSIVLVKDETPKAISGELPY